MPQIRHPEWRESNEDNSYPFAAKATLRNSAGTISIPETTFLDAHLYPIGALAGLYLRTISLNFDSCVLTIADEVQDVCTGTFSPISPPDNIELVDTYGRPAGILISESIRLAFFLSLGVGTYEFTAAQTGFAATCCMPTPEVGVRGIQLEDGSLFAGPTWIIGDDGVVLRSESVTLPVEACGDAEETVEVIRVDVVGDPLYRRRLCNPLSLFQTPNPVRQVAVRERGRLLTVCTPDAHGNLSIQRNDSEVADSAIRIRTTKDGLIFEVAGDSNTGT